MKLIQHKKNKQSSRTTIKRMHSAVDHCFKQLGPKILFPTEVHLLKPQVKFLTDFGDRDDDGVMTSKKEQTKLNIEDFIVACDKLRKDKTGAIFVFERNNNLDFVKEDGDTINAELSLPIIESIFYKNSPLHDGAVIVVGNIIVASRVTLPVSKNRKINKSLGLRHKAGIGITEESDAISIVISEETGKLSYIKNGKIVDYKNDELNGACRYFKIVRECSGG